MKACKLIYLAALLTLTGFQYNNALAAEPLPQEILEKSCSIYSENWQGLRYHYPGGKGDFLKKCLAATQGKNLVDGLWAIRSMMSDGHADFQIIDGKYPSKIYPLVLRYDLLTQELRVEAALDSAFTHYVGKKVEKIGGRMVIDALMDRVQLEPQSSLTSSLEIASRTLTITYAEKPYPDFPKQLDLAFEDRSRIVISPWDLDSLAETNRYVVSSNGYPSLWGAADVSEKNGYCIHKREISKTIIFNGKKWFWWHPRGIKFDPDQLDEAFSCWNAGVADTQGVVLDLRDTAGGSFEAVYVLGYQFGMAISPTVKTRISDGEIAAALIKEEGGVLGPKTENGYIREIEIETPDFVKNIKPWSGKLIVITNGLCGSACDMIAYHLQSRKDTCTYGTPTGGRLIGYDDVHPVSPESGIHIDLSLPYDEILKPDGSRWEGKPIIPGHLGSGGVMEALETCSR